MKNIKLLTIFFLFCIPGMFSPQAQQSQDRDVKRLFSRIDKNREDHIAFLQQLIRAQEEGEEAIQAVVADKFRELRCEVETLRMLPANLSMKHQFAAKTAIPAVVRISVVGKFPASGSGRSLLLFAHPDGVDVAALRAPTILAAATWLQPGADEAQKERARGLLGQTLDSLRAEVEPDGSTLYTIAAIESLVGDRERALTAFDAAYEGEFRWSELAALNPMLDGIREDPRFRQAMRDMEEDIRAMRDRYLALPAGEELDYWLEILPRMRLAF